MAQESVADFKQKLVNWDYFKNKIMNGDNNITY